MNYFFIHRRHLIRQVWRYVIYFHAMHLEKVSNVWPDSARLPIGLALKANQLTRFIPSVVSLHVSARGFGLAMG